MRYLYPVTLQQDENNQFVATCRDIPEAITGGESKIEALNCMSDALGAALAGYSLDGPNIPVPSRLLKNEYRVPVPPLIAAKLVLRSAMAEKGYSNVTLAKHLGLSEGAVRRLVNPDHASKLDGVIHALALVGRQLVVEDLLAEPG